MNFSFRVAGRYVTASYYEQPADQIVCNSFSKVYVAGHAAHVSLLHAKAIAFMLDSGVRSLNINGVNIVREN